MQEVVEAPWKPDWYNTHTAAFGVVSSQTIQTVVIELRAHHLECCGRINNKGGGGGPNSKHGGLKVGSHQITHLQLHNHAVTYATSRAEEISF